MWTPQQRRAYRANDEDPLRTQQNSSAATSLLTVPEDCTPLFVRAAAFARLLREGVEGTPGMPTPKFSTLNQCSHPCARKGTCKHPCCIASRVEPTGLAPPSLPVVIPVIVYGRKVSSRTVPVDEVCAMTVSRYAPTAEEPAEPSLPRQSPLSATPSPTLRTGATPHRRQPAFALLRPEGDIFASPVLVSPSKTTMGRSGPCVTVQDDSSSLEHVTSATPPASARLASRSPMPALTRAFDPTVLDESPPFPSVDPPRSDPALAPTAAPAWHPNPSATAPGPTLVVVAPTAPIVVAPCLRIASVVPEQPEGPPSMSMVSMVSVGPPAAAQSRKCVRYYAVRNGRSDESGVFTSWEACEARVKGVSCARHARFNTESEAWAFVNRGRPAAPPAPVPSPAHRPAPQAQPATREAPDDLCTPDEPRPPLAPDAPHAAAIPPSRVLPLGMVPPEEYGASLAKASREYKVAPTAPLQPQPSVAVLPRWVLPLGMVPPEEYGASLAKASREYKVAPTAPLQPQPSVAVLPHRVLPLAPTTTERCGIVEVATLVSDTSLLDCSETIMVFVQAKGLSATITSTRVLSVGADVSCASLRKLIGEVLAPLPTAPHLLVLTCGGIQLDDQPSIREVGVANRSMIFVTARLRGAMQAPPAPRLAAAPSVEEDEAAARDANLSSERDARHRLAANAELAKNAVQAKNSPPTYRSILAKVMASVWWITFMVALGEGNVAASRCDAPLGVILVVMCYDLVRALFVGAAHWRVEDVHAVKKKKIQNSRDVARLVAADSVSGGACSRSGGRNDGLGGTVGVSCAVREHVRGGHWAWVDTTMSGPRYPSLGSFCSFG